MAKKDGMYCYYDWVKPLKKVPAEDFKELFIAMLEFHRDGTPPPEFNGITEMAADFIFPQIARSKKYAINGAKGGEATQSKTNASTNGSSLILKTNTETKTQTDTYTYTTTRNSEARETSEAFSRFWETYPKHTAKKEAQAAFESLSLSEAEFDELIEFVELWRNSDQWQREGGRFITRPDKFLLDIFPERSRPPESSKSTQPAWSFETDAAWETALRRSYGDLLDGGG